MALYYRTGRFSEAFELAREHRLREPQDSAGPNQEATMAAFSSFPRQIVVRRRFARLKLPMEPGRLFVPAPITINGSGARYMIDSAADLCVSSRAEARRLGLALHTNDARATGSGGLGFEFATAVADTFTIGKVELKNVAFYVLPDGQPPFNELPVDQQGLIGNPVLQACETLRWKSGGILEVAFHAQKPNRRESNLCFDNATPVLRVECHDRSFPFVLDTGSIETVLYPSFARMFSNWLHQVGTEGYTTMIGFGGNPRVHCVTAPETALRFGGREAILKPAKVFLESTGQNSPYFYGLLGVDLLNKFHEVTIDYHALRLSVK
jgi:hypothetical protein